MWRLLMLAVVQSMLLSFGQLTMKLAFTRMPRFSWSAEFWWGLLSNWWFALCGIFFGTASLLWMYILRHYPLSQAAPMASISYVFSLLMALVFLHEDVSWNRWLGIVLIMAGCVFVAGK